MGPEVEAEVEEACKIIFSSANWSDMEYNILRHTRSDQVLVTLGVISQTMMIKVGVWVQISKDSKQSMESGSYKM